MRNRKPDRCVQSDVNLEFEGKYLCLVCGYGLDAGPFWTELGDGSHEICPSCGYHFGFDDQDRGVSYEQWRNDWIQSGMRWWFREAPTNWDPVEQLARITPTINRRNNLIHLLTLNVLPIDAAVDRLKRRHSDGPELIALTRSHAARLMRFYRCGAIGADECVLWAGAIEMRDDVGRESGAEDLLNEFLFEVATPQLNGPLTPERAEHWVRRLR